MNKFSFRLFLLRITAVLFATHIYFGSVVEQKNFLFDATKAETVGNKERIFHRCGESAAREIARKTKVLFAAKGAQDYCNVITASL